MNKKEVSEIKKLLDPRNQTLSRIAGCYVSAEKEIISTFSSSLALLEEEEIFKYLEIFRKILSGGLGKTLVNMEFTNEAEDENGPERLLYDINNEGLQKEDLLDRFYKAIIENYSMDGNYVILLAANAYDVPRKGTDNLTQFDSSDEVFKYIQCAVCPVTLAKPGLSYDNSSQEFHNRERDWVIDKPVLGLLFPAFTDRSSDIHSILFYTKNSEDLHTDFTDGVLSCKIPLTAGSQKEAFQLVVEQALGENCSFGNVKDIQDALLEMPKDPVDGSAPASIGKNEMRSILHDAGIEDSEMEGFDEAFDEVIGKGGDLQASNVVPKTTMEIKTSDVIITINAEKSNLVETRIIDGRKYMVIPVTDTIMINGISVSD